jgi:hypothetical protein
MNEESAARKWIRHWAFERVRFDVGWMLLTDRGEHLTQKEYLDGLARERKAMLNISGILFYSSLALGLMLAASAGSYGLSISVAGVQVTGVTITSDLLVVAASLVFALHLSYCYAYFTIEAILNKLYSEVGSQHEFHSIDRIGYHALNLLIEPRTFGYASGGWQMAIALLLCFLVLAIYIVLIAIPVIAIFNYSVSVLWADATIGLSDLAAIFALGVLAAAGVSLILVLYPFKYTLRADD